MFSLPYNFGAGGHLPLIPSSHIPFLLWLWVREFLRHLCIDCCLRIKLYRQSTQWEISQMPESQEKDLVGIQTRSQNPERCLKVCISNLHVDFCFLVVFGKLAFGIPTFLGFIPLSQLYHHFELDGLSHAHNPTHVYYFSCHVRNCRLRLEVEVLYCCRFWKGCQVFVVTAYSHERRCTVQFSDQNHLRFTATNPAKNRPA